MTIDYRARSLAARMSETGDELLAAVRDDARLQRRVQELIDDLAAFEIDLVDRIDGAADPEGG